jgi:hypothetical protein
MEHTWRYWIQEESDMIQHHEERVDCIQSIQFKSTLFRADTSYSAMFVIV